MLLPDFCSSHTTDAEGHVLGADTEVDIFDPLVAADVCLTISAARQEAQLQAKAPDGVSLERISGAPGSSPIAPDARMSVTWARVPLLCPWPRGEGSPMAVDPLRGAGGSRRHTALHRAPRYRPPGHRSLARGRPVAPGRYRWCRTGRPSRNLAQVGRIPRGTA